MSAAGRSALRRSRQLYWSVHPLRLYGPSAVGSATFGGILLASGMVPTGAFWAAVGLFVMLYMSTKVRTRKNIPAIKAEAKRYRTGGKAEQRTGQTLWWLRIRRGPYYVFHDRKIPGSNANIDHIVVGPGGIDVVDTKSRKRRWQLQEGQWLFYDNKPVDVSTSAWETGEVRKAVNQKFGVGTIPVRASWAIHAVRFPFRKFIVDDVTLLNVWRIVKWICGHDRCLSRSQVSAVAAHIEKQFPQYKG